MLLKGMGRRLIFWTETDRQAFIRRVHLSVVGIGKEMYTKPVFSDRDRQTHIHTHRQSVSYPKRTPAGVGYGQGDVHKACSFRQQIDRHVYTDIQTVSPLPQEYTGWWWVRAERCTRSLFCQTNDQQTHMHTYRQSVSYRKSTSAGGRYGQRDVHEGLEGHGLLATCPTHQRRLQLTLARKIHINFDFHAAPPFLMPFIA